MNKKIIFIIILIVITVITIFKFAPQGWEGKKMISPFSGTVQTPVPSPTPIKKEFKFNSSTDLKVELEKVNPQILDSDFE
mgnify:FL=1